MYLQYERVKSLHAKDITKYEKSISDETITTTLIYSYWKKSKQKIYNKSILTQTIIEVYRHQQILQYQ